jgi:hypothetical protein
VARRTPRLPPLPLESWRPTKETLHRIVQVLGKVRLAHAPWRNHWWHVTLRVTPRGLTTGLVPSPAEDFEVDLDLLRQVATLRTSTGGEERFALREGVSVADFHRWLVERLRGLGVEAGIRPVPYDLRPSVPFAEDAEHASHDPAALERFATVLRFSEGVLEEVAGRFVGKTSPVHFFWHAFDLAHTRFSGRLAPPREGANAVEREAYSQEVVSFGFWPGDDQVPEPSYYAYAAPEPEGLTRAPLLPRKGARWRGEFGQALLSYEDVRRSADPRGTLLSFFDSVWDAARERGGWPEPVRA